MAKRKRLQPAQGSYLEGTPSATSDAAPQAVTKKPAITPSVAAPIAQVASETAATAALEELSDVLETARAKGLMIEELSLATIDPSYLVRDRVSYDEAEMQGLMQSIMLRGQQTPIEVVKFDVPKEGKTHGLISGWRRMEALNRLYKENSEPERFTTIKARIVHPNDAQEAYVAMVEENEIRVNLSHYERARIALKALEMGLYDDQRRAILGLFGNASRTKRSKIASFAALVTALDSSLRFPTAISEKLGLGLVSRLDADAGFAPALRDKLCVASVSQATQEVEILSAALEENQSLRSSLGTKNASDPIRDRTTDLSPAPGPSASVPPVPIAETAGAAKNWQELPGGLRLRFEVGAEAGAGRIELSGHSVDADLHDALKAWLSGR